MFLIVSYGFCHRFAPVDMQKRSKREEDGERRLLILKIKNKQAAQERQQTLPHPQPSASESINPNGSAIN